MKIWGKRSAGTAGGTIIRVGSMAFGIPRDPTIAQIVFQGGPCSYKKVDATL